MTENAVLEQVFTSSEMIKIREKFMYVGEDKNGNDRLYFDNAGGSFRLKAAEEVFKKIDDIPDCSERKHNMALFLQEIEDQGRQDARIIFNADDGAIYPGYTASMLMFEIIRVISENVAGTNMVTTVLEHPSSFDAMKMYSEKHGCELRIAQSNPETGGVTVDEIISHVDENTRILSVMAASNISGYIFDIEQVVERAREIQPDIYIVIDAVQHAPHGTLDIKKLKVDAMNIAPYKFFGIRGFGLAYLSNRVAKMSHHKLNGKAEMDWELGSPAPAHYAALTEVVNYVVWLGSDFGSVEGNRRELFVRGMNKIHMHERLLLKTLLDGTDKVPGLRSMEGVEVFVDNENLEERDLIIGIGFDHIEPSAAVREYEQRNVIVYERVKASLYSKRMIESFNLEGMIRVSPLHCNTIEEIEKFLEITQELATQG